jgi:hypothetical protein
MEREKHIHIESQQFLVEDTAGRAADEVQPTRSHFQAAPPVMAPLDYKRVKDFLRAALKDESQEIEVCATLQALGWRVTRVKRGIRKQNLHSYGLYDILELKSGAPGGIAEQVLAGKAPKRVREFFIILLNALATEYLGRCYLLQRRDIVSSLI